MPGGGPKDCPNCGTPNVESSLFCEACGYDFTTGALPAGVVTNVEAPPAEAPAPGARSPELAQVEVDNAVENLGADPDPQPSNPAGEALESSGAAEQAAEAEGMGAAAGIPASSVGSGSGVPPRIAFQWVAEVWIDPDWYADQQAQEPLPSAGLYSRHSVPASLASRPELQKNTLVRPERSTSRRANSSCRGTW